MTTKTPANAIKRVPSKIKKVTEQSVFRNAQWTVCRGMLTKPVKVGRPIKDVEHLFKVVGEKLPYESLSKVSQALKEEGVGTKGVYVAHDSMGCPRYIGRGDIFSRLAQHKKKYKLELTYFSFYVVAEKKHEREVETLLIRAAGFLLELNDRKKGWGVYPGDIKDYETGTIFFERHYKKGRAAG